MNRICVALPAALALAVIAGPAVPEETPTGKSLVRLVCPLEDGSFHRILILEQTSTEPLNETTFEHTTDGTVLIDPEIIVTNHAPFRLRVYDASLSSGNGTEEDIIEALLSREADRDMDGRLMDYTGEGFHLWGEIIFDSTAPYSFTKRVFVSMNDYKGSMTTNLGGSNMLEDGFYECREPVFIPELAGEESG